MYIKLILLISIFNSFAYAQLRVNASRERNWDFPIESFFTEKDYVGGDLIREFIERNHSYKLKEKYCHRGVAQTGMFNTAISTGCKLEKIEVRKLYIGNYYNINPIFNCYGQEKDFINDYVICEGYSPQ